MNMGIGIERNRDSKNHNINWVFTVTGSKQMIALTIKRVIHSTRSMKRIMKKRLLHLSISGMITAITSPRTASENEMLAMKKSSREKSFIYILLR